MCLLYRQNGKGEEYCRCTHEPANIEPIRDPSKLKEVCAVMLDPAIQMMDELPHYQDRPSLCGGMAGNS